MFNEFATWGTLGYEKALYLDELSDAADRGDQRARAAKDLAVVVLPDLHLVRRVPRRARQRHGLRRQPPARHVFNIEAAASDRQTYGADRAWVRSFWDAMRPHATGSGGYVNFLVEADEARVRASYGDDKYQRLARIKAEYDPRTCFT